MSAPPTSCGSNPQPGSVSGSQGHTATEPVGGRDQPHHRPAESSRPARPAQVALWSWAAARTEADQVKVTAPSDSICALQLTRPEKPRRVQIGGNARLTERGAGDRSCSAGGRASRLQTAAVLVTRRRPRLSRCHAGAHWAIAPMNRSRSIWSGCGICACAIPSTAAWTMNGAERWRKACGEVGMARVSLRAVKLRAHCAACGTAPAQPGSAPPASRSAGRPGRPAYARTPAPTRP